MKNKISPLGWLVAGVLLTAAAVVPIQSNFFTSTNYQGTTASTARTYLGLQSGATANFESTQFNTNNSNVTIKANTSITNALLPGTVSAGVIHAEVGSFNTADPSIPALVANGGATPTTNIFEAKKSSTVNAGVDSSGILFGQALRASNGSPTSAKFLKFTDTLGNTSPALITASDVSGFDSEVTNVINTNYSDTIWNKNIALVFTGDSLTSTDQVNWPVFLTNTTGPWSNAPIGFATNTAIGSDLVGNIWTNYNTRIGQYILATASATTNVYLFIEGGGNDLGSPGGHLGATNVITSLSNIWWKARSQGAKVVAFTISDSVNFTYEDQLERMNLNRMIRQSGKYGTNGWDYLVDWDQYISADTPGDGGFPSWFNNTLDGVHFTTNSSRLIAKMVDWAFRNGERGNSPGPFSQIDSTRAAGAPHKWLNNLFRRGQTYQPDYILDNAAGIFGAGITLQDPTNYTAIVFRGPTISSALWDDFPAGQFSFWAGGDYNTANTGQYMGFTFATKSWLFKDHLQTPDFTANTILATNSVTFGASGPKQLSGSGSPEGAITAVVGSIYMRTDGGSGTSMYVKQSGSGNTGWTAVNPSGASSIVVATVASLHLTSGVSTTTLYTPNGHTMYEVSAVFTMGSGVLQTNTLTLAWRDNVSNSNEVNLIDHVVKGTTGSINVAPYTFLAANAVTISYSLTTDGSTGSSDNYLYIALKELQ